MLFEISPTDPLTFLAVFLLLLLSAVIATLIPAAQVTRLDPVQALSAD